MNTINKMGLRIGALTATAVLLIYGLYWGGRELYARLKPPEATPTAAPTALARDGAAAEPQAKAPTATDDDADGDGIPDKYEAIYGTAANKADTDGDGTYDLNEIVEGRDPLKSGPDDEIKPPTGAKVTATNTYTAKYLQSLPENVPRAEILSKARVEAFVQAQKGALLPAVTDKDIKISSESGQEAIKKYLNSISVSMNPGLTAVTSDGIEQAFQAQLSDPNALKSILAALQKNVSVIKAIPVPKEAVELHKKFLAASQALSQGVEMLENMPDDFIGGLIGAKKIEDLGLVFQNIEQDVQKLQQE